MKRKHNRKVVHENEIKAGYTEEHLRFAEVEERCIK